MIIQATVHLDGARMTRTRTVGVETPGDARELLATLGVTNIQFHTYYRRGALRFATGTGTRRGTHVSCEFERRH